MNNINSLWKHKIKVKRNSQLSDEYAISHVVRQACPLLPITFNTYLNEVKVQWNQIYTKGITLSTSRIIDTLPFENNQNIMAHSEDNLQREY